MTTIDINQYSTNVILGNGDFPSSQIPKDVLNSASRLVVCDGAANSFIGLGQDFEVIIGDCDSIDRTIMEKESHRIIIVNDQETNDQTKAVNYFNSHGINNISIIGATGQREDHSLGNISLLIEYLKQGTTARIYTDHGVFVPLFKNSVLKTTPHAKISIFNFGCKTLNATGLKYPIRPFDSLWQGTLNETTENEVIFEADNYYMLYIAY